MFTLEYFNSEKEKQPEHDSHICYYVLNKNYQWNISTSQSFARVTYEWYSSCGERNEYYNPETEDHFKIGDKREGTYYNEEEDRESHKYLILTLCLDGQPNWRNLEEEIGVFAWNYTHEVRHAINQHQTGDYFPTFDINNLLRTGVIEVVGYDKNYIPDNVGYTSGDYYQIQAILKYKGKLYSVGMSQEEMWDEDDWTDTKVNAKVFGKVAVFRWECLGGKYERN